MPCFHEHRVELRRVDSAVGAGILVVSRCSDCRHEACGEVSFLRIHMLSSLRSDFSAETLSEHLLPTAWDRKVMFCPCVACTIERLACRHTHHSGIELSTGRYCCDACGTKLHLAEGRIRETLNNMAGVMNGGVRGQRELH